MKTLTFFTAALVFASAGQVWPQQTPASAAPATSATPAPAQASADTTVKIQDGAAAPAVSKSAAAGTLSVDFPDQDIRTVLRNVADLFELNLVIPDTLQGRTSIKLRDVTWQQIFQVVLSPVGYTYVQDGNIIKVVSLASLQQEPTVTRVFILNYARASDILPTVSSLVDGSKGGRIVVDARSNALVITERPSHMKEINDIIQKLDTATDQVMIESKFIEVTDNDIKNIGVNWASLNNFSVSGGPFSQSYNRNVTQATTNGNNTNNTSGTQVQTGTQTQVITSTSPITGNTNVQVTQVPTDTNLTSTANTLSDLASLANSANITRAATAVFNADQFQLILSALKTLNDTKLVSNPTVVTLNNTQAKINIGEKYPIPSYSYNQERGTFEVSGFQFMDIGIGLTVTPQVSSQSGTTSFGGASGAQIPIISTRDVTTQVSLKDGYTMGIGGLVESNTNNVQTKVPLLGSIPFLGRLFRSDSNQKASRNLIIFITAKTISADGAPVEQVFDTRTLQDLHLKRSDLPGYRTGENPFLPEDPPAAAPARSR